MRYLILSASMGAGHDGVARELAARLSAEGHDTRTVDVLRLLPLRTGALLRGFYGGTLRHAPWVYQAIYRVFFEPRRVRPSVGPFVALALPALRAEVSRYRPDTVVSTFHVGAQATGELRRRGELTVPAAVALVDFAVHDLWLHRGNDLYLCTHPGAAEAVRAALGCAARSTGPVVSGRFLAAPDQDRDPVAVRRRFGLPASGRLVVVAGGSLGMGSGVRAAARALARSGRYAPVVLCGSNERLRRDLAAAGVPALGWVEDVPSLFSVAYALVENGGGGLTCAEAFAAGLPVVSHRPIPGHGRAGARVLAAAGLAAEAPDEDALLRALDGLAAQGPRERQVRAARALFVEDAARVLAHLGGRAAGAPSVPGHGRAGGRRGLSVAWGTVGEGP